MQVASPYSSLIPHSHYHSYYQLHPPGPQDHDLKRQYLALLPPQQIIEICLTFDIHVPPYIKSTVWPPDINAAIAKLQKATSPQAPAETPTDDTPDDGEAIMDSLKSPSPTKSTPAAQETLPDTEPQPPDKEAPSSTPDSSTAPSVPADDATTPPTQNTQSTSSTPPEPPRPAPPAQPHYPHQPYGYAHLQATYPISPYYAQPPGAYSYPYGAYAAPMQNPYHTQPPTAYPPQPPSMYNNMLPISHLPQQQQQQEGPAADDLPSYEEMIVEALTGCADPEGLAPKDLFTLMVSRYPLQSNFRPSASQALQKAYKRGRFEKSSNGKYRLNPTWEGGNTTRRTTRRPQTQNTQSTPSTSTPAPPFTHAPLVHHHHASSSQPATQPPYPTQGYAYPPYPHVSYPGYPTQPQPSSTAATTAHGASSTSTADKAAPGTSNADAASDAYEAAQNILSAINFGSMYQLAPEEQQGEGGKNMEEQRTAADQAGGGNGVEQLLSHVQAMLASNAANAAAAPDAIAPPPPQIANDGSVEDPRAELQAQLALLAAQLAELAQTEDMPPVQATPAAAPAHVPVPPPQSLSAPPPVPIHAPAPVSAVPVPPTPDLTDDMPDPLPEEEESDDDDDDMEEII